MAACSCTLFASYPVRQFIQLVSTYGVLVILRIKRWNYRNSNIKEPHFEAYSSVKEIKHTRQRMGFPGGGALVENLSANVGDSGDVGLIPGLGRSPGEGNGNPLQYSCLENFMDRGG